ncbi:MAG: hypothetical protein IJM79_06675 [Erysipelotrichaceae bacterium]|nr:hypothetical protein [Erysipelotrichaceae bacterium]
MMRREVPVYLITGFLEAGKTRFIIDTLHDPSFNDGSPTLIIVCEQGEIEYEPDEKYMDSCHLEYLTSEADLTAEKLTELEDRYQATQILIEYNGMWLLQSLFDNKPDHWLIYQSMMFIDSTTYEAYNQMFRNLMVDKINNTELVIFNRVDPNRDITLLHAMIRAVNRRRQICYEYPDGTTQYDDTVDELPFDFSKDDIYVDLEDYAVWYRDIADDYSRYEGKKVHLQAMIVENVYTRKQYTIGRQVMTCCVADITFRGLMCENRTPEKLQMGCWYDVVAEVVEKYSEGYGGMGPVLEIIEARRCEKPQNEVATFY